MGKLLLEFLGQLAGDYRKVTGFVIALVVTFPFWVIALDRAERWGMLGTPPETRLLSDIETSMRLMVVQHGEQIKGITTAVESLDRNLGVIESGADRTVDRLDDLCVIQSMQTKTTEDDQICAGITSRYDRANTATIRRP